MQHLAKLRWIKLTEQPAERIVARQAVRQPQEATKKSLLRLRKKRHVNRPLAAVKYRAKRDHQKLVKIMQSSVPGPGVLKAIPTSRKFIQQFIPQRSIRHKVESTPPESGNQTKPHHKISKCDFPALLRESESITAIPAAASPDSCG